jgi:sucrose phosphorylase
MIDAVINHVSAKSAWFRGFLDGDPEYADHFISVDPAADLSAVVRPRDLPLLTPVQTSLGQRHVWTTFSPDQVDLNYANPSVLLEMLDVLLSYVQHGAQFIRLDAIAFLWKEIGSSSIHLPQTHRVVKFMRDVLQAVAPWVFLITETNVPHDENISYFGNGSDEAHMVYQFALPPLVLHTFHSGDATRLTEWAAQLQTPSPQTAFFNFLASHDGIGLRPARGILSDEEIEALLALAEERGGAVSYRALESGESDPYELNVSYLDALTPPDEWHASADRAAARFLASQAILLALQGLPGIYFHSLFGSRNDAAGVSRSGRLRSINREKFAMEDLEATLTDSTSLRGQVLAGFKRLLAARRANPAFHPAGFQEILDLGTAVFATLRTASGSGERVLCLHEVAGVGASIAAPLGAEATSEAIDMITGQTVSLSQLQMSPYQVLWIRIDELAK